MTDKSDYLVSARLAKDKLARIFEDLAKASRCEDDRLCRCGCGQAELAIAETIRNTDLTDCQLFETADALIEALKAPDQGSVRNATDRLTDDELIAAWQSAQPTSPLESNDLLRVYVHYMRAVADAQLKKAIRALPDQKD